MKTLVLTLIFYCSIFKLFAEQNNINLQLSWKNQFQFAGYYMAIEKGFYDKVNLKVNIKELNSESDPIEAIRRGDAQFAIGRSSLLIDKVKGEHIVALGAFSQHSPMVLLTRNDPDINTIKDLKNKRVMITTDARISATIIAMLNANNIKLEDLTVQKHSFNLNDLINNRTDAVASYISNEPIQLREKGVDYKIFNPRDYGFDFYDDILFTSSFFIQNNRETTKIFFKATLKGWYYAYKNIDETAKIIYEKYNTQNKSLYSLIEEGKALKKNALGDDITKIGYLDKERLTKINDIYKVLGLIESDVNLNDFIYEGNNYDIVKLQFKDKDLYLYIFAFSIVIGTIILIMIYLVIKKKWLITTKTLKSEIEEKTKLLKEQSMTDTLTNVRNRKAYNEKIKELLNDYKRYRNNFCLISIDLDDFKKVNDEFGHKVGDEVLISFCKLAQSHLRTNDFLFRMGGEEFMILLPNVKLESGINVSKKLLKSCFDNLKANDEKRVTISIGLVEVLEHESETTLYKRVDNLLYDSKKNGKNRLSF